MQDHEEEREERMWRLAAGRGRGRVGNFLLLKLTNPSQEKAGTREEPKKSERFLISQVLRNQPQKDCSWAFATNTKNLYLERGGCSQEHHCKCPRRRFWFLNKRL